MDRTKLMAFLASALAAFAPTPSTAQSSVDRAKTEFEAAKAAKGRGELEACALHIRRARRALASSSDAPKSLKKDIDSFAKRHDNRDSKRAKSESIAAKHLIRVAEKYIASGWLDHATPLLREARALAPKATVAAMRKLAKARSNGNATSTLAEVFLNGENIFGTGKWQFDGDELVSPKFGKEKCLRIGDRRLVFDGAKRSLAIELKGEQDLDFRFVFAFRHIEEFCQLRVLLRPGNAYLAFEHITNRGEHFKLSEKTVPLSADERANWLRIVVSCHDQTLHAQISNKAALEAKAPTTPLRGFVGLMLVGEKAENAPVRFRNLELLGVE